MHILHVVGARPNFMKAAPVFAALAASGARQTLVHTGQHYDVQLSAAIFSDLGLPEPEMNLGVGSGSHASQTAQVLQGMEGVLIESRSDMLLVYGDVNSTVAAALAAAKLNLPVGHVEAGLRSGDRTMPEEINRIVTDRLATSLFTPSRDADANLLAEGVPREWIHCVGNVMIDSLVRLLPRAVVSELPASLNVTGRKGSRPFVLVTLHRPSNVDDGPMLRRIAEALSALSRELIVVFPMHPRTRARLEQLRVPIGNVLALEPLTYVDFLALQRLAAVVVTDSGGIQEETSYLNVPCLTLRDNTERPITVDVGTNTLIGRHPERLAGEITRSLDTNLPERRAIPLWDGKAAIRIADAIMSLACVRSS